MPVIDGFEVLRRLKENPSTSHIPVIILTAKIDAASERECTHLGAVDYIKKPWGPHELEDRIGMALGYPKLSPPGFLSLDESHDEGPVDGGENPDLDQIPELPALWAPLESRPENLENSDTDQPRTFRTRTFQVRPDGVDPSSLI